jgi:hypothetical protein
VVLAGHYVNFPLFARLEDAAVVDLTTVNRQDALPVTLSDENALNVMQALELNRRVLTSPASSNQDKALHLAWLMQLVGDIHQPLHATALVTPKLFPEGDRGGNEIKIAGPTNLHKRWDDLLGSPATVGSVGTKATQIISEYRAMGEKAARCMDAGH